MLWKIAEAKKRFSEMIKKVNKEPQIIQNRDNVVAIVINPVEYERFRMYMDSKKSDTIAKVFEDLRKICNDEDYKITVPERENRDMNW